ncbi:MULTISPECIES: hypothetical protein [Pantoea]|nr:MULTISPECIES: hypothetical protein [Pantoea]
MRARPASGAETRASAASDADWPPPFFSAALPDPFTGKGETLR